MNELTAVYTVLGEYAFKLRVLEDKYNDLNLEYKKLQIKMDQLEATQMEQDDASETAT